MGIYISDLEIPKDKAVQIVIIRDDGICVDEWGNTYGVVSLPLHGDLIDRDALERMFVDIDNAPYSGFDGEEPFYSVEDAVQIIRLAPTIIQVEPPKEEK